jgi:hypothetical protein
MILNKYYYKKGRCENPYSRGDLFCSIQFLVLNHSFEYVVVVLLDFDNINSCR